MTNFTVVVPLAALLVVSYQLLHAIQMVSSLPILGFGHVLFILNIETDDARDPKDGRIPYRRILLRVILAIIAMSLVYVWFENENTRPLAKVTDEIQKIRFMPVNCSSDYEEERKSFPDCVPKKCGRVVTDSVVMESEVRYLLKTAKAGLALGGSNGGASILDLHSGALSKGDKFINIYSVMDSNKKPVFTQKDFDIYRNVKDRIHAAIAKQFEVPKHMLYLTSPTFFSQMTTREATTVHDEYWHVHTDKQTYGSFHYTSLLYLTDYEKDFTGGRFVFVDSPQNTTIEPKRGRLSFFTSGAENPHYVEKLKSGTRYAITVSFTCDPDKAIDDPRLKT